MAEEMQNRHERWVRASFALAPYEQMLVPVVQGLGRLDCRLIAEDHRFLGLSESERCAEAELMRFDEQRTLSYLWVLGAYEVVRTVDARIRKADGDRTTSEEAVAALKKHFTRLRVPLAKMEAADRHRNTDSHIAYPAMHVEHGAAWQLAANVFIARLELSDALLSLIERLRADDPRLP